MTQYNFRPYRQTYGEAAKQEALNSLPWQPDILSYLMQRPLHGYQGVTLPNGNLGEVAHNRKSGWIAYGGDPVHTATHELLHMTPGGPLSADKKQFTRDLKGLMSNYYEMFPGRYFQGQETGLDSLVGTAPSWVPLPPENELPIESRRYRGTPFPTESLLDFLAGYPSSRRAEEMATEGIAKYGGSYAPTRRIYETLFTK